VGQETGGSFATVFRMVRLLRVLRIFRLLKVLKPLFLLAVGLIEACKAIIWVSVLMGTVLYVFSIVLVRTVGETSRADPHYEFLLEHFSTIPNAMITLFILMSSPNLPIYQDEDGLLSARPIFCIFLIMFICFGSFGMIAMLTGVINESMFENNELRKAEKKLEHEAMRLSLGRRSADLYESLPLDVNGFARVEDLKQIAEPAADLLDLAGVQIAHGDVLKFLELMDDDESGRVNMKDFVHAIEKIAEGLSPLAIVEVQHYLTLCNKKLGDQLDHISGVDDKIEVQLAQICDETDRILKVMNEVHDEHKNHLADKMECQIDKTSEQVNRILQHVSSEQDQHRAHLAEKIESQMQRTSEEVDRILQVVTEDHNEHRSHLVEKIETQVMRIGGDVERILKALDLGGSKILTSPTGMAADASEMLDLSSSAPAASEVPSFESSVGVAVSKQTEDVAATFQSIVDRKFSDLERQLALREGTEKRTLLALSSQTLCQIQDISTVLQKMSQDAASQPKLDEILSSVQDLHKKEEVIESLRLDLARLMQESKNSVVRVAKAQEAINDSFDALSNKVSAMQDHSDSGQTKVLSSISELGGEIVKSLSGLLSANLSSLKQDLTKQDLTLQRFHIGSTISREDTIGSIPDSSSLCSSYRHLGQQPQNLSEHLLDRAGNGSSRRDV